MTNNLDIKKYNTTSWSWTILFCVLLLLYTNAVSVWKTAPSLALCILLLIPRPSVLLLSYRAIASWIIGIGVLLLAGIDLLEVRNLGDFATLMLEGVAGLLPISLMHRDKFVSYWLSLLNTTIVAIGCMLFKGDLVVYFLLAGFLTSLLFNLNSANLLLLTRNSSEVKSPLPNGFFRQFIASVPIGIAAGALIFFAFPRVKSIGMFFNIGEPSNRTGYTGRIELEGGRQIDESAALAFIAMSNDIEWLRKDGWDMLFRGTTLATFDGKKWVPQPSEPSIYQNQDLRVNQKHAPEPHSVMIFMEPNSEDAIFYPGSLFAFTKVPKNVGTIMVDAFANITRSDTSRSRFSYEIQSFPINILNPGLQQSLADDAEKSQERQKETALPFQLTDTTYAVYTSIPDSIMKAPWFRNWVSSVQTSNGRIVPSKTKISEAMRALKLHFEDNFEASLINQFSSADSFQSFITTDRRGHCEYFATAAALFFRSFGIPARIVLGYRGGRFNEVAKTLEVREESAHAWTEIFIDGTGWYPYDPTPMGPPTTGSSSSSLFSNYLNAAKFWFNRYVIDYDRSTQKDIIQSIQDLGYKQGSDQWSAVEWFKSISMPVLEATGGIILLLVLVKFWRRRDAVQTLPRYYMLYQAMLKRRGYERRIGETYQNFHQRICEELVADPIHQTVADAIERDLYAPLKTDADFRKTLRRSIRISLKKSA